jgi:hypothetical protein
MMRALESSVQRALNDSLESFDRLSTKGYQSEIREKLFLHADLVEALLAFFSSLLGAVVLPDVQATRESCRARKSAGLL